MSIRMQAGRESSVKPVLEFGFTLAEDPADLEVCGGPENWSVAPSTCAPDRASTK